MNSIFILSHGLMLFRYALAFSTPALLPGKSHGWRSLVGCSPWDCEELDTTEQFHFHFRLSCTEEGNGNQLRCSCLENPRDGGAWWVVIYGVAQSRTRQKRLSSSSSDAGDPGSVPVRKIPWRRKWQPTPVFLPGKIPWTEEPSRLHTVHGVSKSWTRLSG